MRGFFSLLNRFRTDERGVFAVIFGLIAIVLVAMAGSAVDYTSLEMARSKAQYALDSAALGLAPTIYDDPTPEELMLKAKDLVVERLGTTNVTVNITSAVPVKSTGTLTLGGTVTVPMAFVQLVGIQTLTASISSQTKKGSVNIEVGVALDVTGSMKDDIDDLQLALATLIPIVVQEEQEPTYSKMAIVPYSTAVKIDTSYINSVRDAITPAKAVTNVTWWNSEKDISGATQARPVVITQTAHGFNNDDLIYISGVKGMTELNGKTYLVKNKTADKFDLYNTDGTRVDGRDFNAYQTTSNDKMKRCILSTCEVIVTATGHGFATNDRVAFSDFSNYMTRLNERSYQITNLTTNTFKLTNVAGYSQTTLNQNGSGGAVSGNSWCTAAYGCNYQYKSSTLLKATPDCVVERMTDSFTDAKPSTKKFAIYYNSGGDCEVNQAVQPLTSDLPTLEAFTAAGGLTDGGGTAGQIGTAWAWYTIAPNFAEVFTGSSAPSAYKAANTQKFVIIMTDGEYNTEHCKGVHTSYAGCAAPDGTTGTMSGAFGQAEDICANIKNDHGITVYTVGFRLGTTGDDVDILKKCASDASKAKLADDGEGLLAAFREIGEELATLRLSQ